MDWKGYFFPASPWDEYERVSERHAHLARWLRFFQATPNDEFALSKAEFEDFFPRGLE